MRILLLLLLTLATARANEVIKLWEDEVPYAKKAKAENIIIEKRPGEFRMTEVTDPELVVYPANPKKHNGICLIMCPGGAYMHLSFMGKGIDFANYFSKEGFTCFVLHYQVPKNRAGALSDATRAVNIVRTRAEEWNIDPQKVGMIGTSAGGHLIAALSAQTEDLAARPNFGILLCPAYLTNKSNGRISPEFNKMKNTPPFFIFTAADDTNWADGSYAFGRELLSKKLPHEFHMVPEGGHGFGLKENNPAAEAWPGLALKWIYLLDL